MTGIYSTQQELGYEWVSAKTEKEMKRGKGWRRDERRQRGNRWDTEKGWKEGGRVQGKLGVNGREREMREGGKEVRKNGS